MFTPHNVLSVRVDVALFFMWFCIIIIMLTVPTPSVTVAAPNTQIVGQSLTLECNVTAVRGITSRVDIIWSSDGVVLSRTNNTSPMMMDSSLVYTETYIISLLSTDDEDREYECEIVINASPVVTATGNVTLDVIGECSIFE